MTTLNIKLLAKQALSLFSERGTRHPRVPQPQAALSGQAPDKDTETAFLASIAHVPEAERARRIQRREWYVRLAARQGIADVEWRAQQYQRTGEEVYRR
jgi:hypothetical protein